MKNLAEMTNVKKIINDYLSREEFDSNDLVSMENDILDELKYFHPEMSEKEIRSYLVNDNRSLAEIISEAGEKAAARVYKKPKLNPVKVLFNKGIDKWKKSSVGMRVIASLAPVAAIGISSAIALSGCGKEEEIKQIPQIVMEDIPDVPDTPDIELEQIPTQTLLSDSLSFDPNSNKTLVENISKFIADSMKKGIAVKDCMSEEEINIARENNVSFVTIEQLMDYYFVVNIEDIDPIDYARLGYNEKTKDSIINNYFACANVFMDDLLTVSLDTVLDFETIIADKESALAVQNFAQLVAKYNDSDDKKAVESEISKYIKDNYIETYDNLYSIPANEQTYRFMFSYDELTNGIGIPSDINIILNEDRTYTCSSAKKDGEKNKTQRAQDETDIFSMIDDKLSISRDYYNQDTKDIDSYELKTGVELEKDIKDAVLVLDPEFIQNPKYIAKTVSTTTLKTSKSSGIKDNNGKEIDIEEFQKYGISIDSPTAKEDYEKAVREEFEKQAAIDSSHVLKNNDGTVVATGSEVDVDAYNKAFQSGYYDGNNNKSYSEPSGQSQKAGYQAGYQKGKEDRKEVDKKVDDKTYTSYQKEENGEVITNITETIEDYTSEPPKIEEEIIYDDSRKDNIETTTIFVPVEDGEQIVTESIEEQGYVTTSLFSIEEQIDNATSYSQLRTVLQNYVDSFEQNEVIKADSQEENVIENETSTQEEAMILIK